LRQEERNSSELELTALATELASLRDRIGRKRLATLPNHLPATGRGFKPSEIASKGSGRKRWPRAGPSPGPGPRAAADRAGGLNAGVPPPGLAALAGSLWTGGSDSAAPSK